MKLYRYSSALIAFPEATRVKTTCAVAGILIGAVIFFASITLNRSIADLFEPHSVKELTLENNILRHQLYLMTPRVNALEGRMGELYELDDNLHVLLPDSTIVRENVPRSIVENKKFKFKSAVQKRKVSDVDFHITLIH